MKKRFMLCLIASVGAIAYYQQSHAQAQQTVGEPVSVRRSEPAPRSHLARRGLDRVSEAVLREASEKSLRLIQRSQAEWSNKETCTSCHHQLIPQFAFELARERGIAFNEKQARESTESAFAYLRDLDEAIQGYEFIDVFFDGWALTAAKVARFSPTAALAASAISVASFQLPDGSWHTIDVRPPQAFSRFTTTALCARAVREYMPVALREEKESRLARAREWLLKAEPGTTEDVTFQLFGLAWTHADTNSRRSIARRLLSEQRADGGWGQLSGLPSDAYSTGEVLSALNESAGIEANSPAYQRGLQFLINSQASDGSWHVQSRLHPPAPVSPKYFEAGFPYKHDQFISMMATAWATTALLRGLPPVQPAEKMTKGESVGTENSKEPDWVMTCLTGTAGDLKKLLDAGMSPDAKCSGGTTALMLAARDREKVQLLLERGANPNLPGSTGITPLMVASRYRGNADVVRLLLNRGAVPNADKSVEVRYNASALFYAVMAGDAETVQVLLEAGARPADKMKILGRFSISPIFYAVFSSDPRLIDELIARGVDPNGLDDDRMSPLAWAVIGNNIGTVRALLARGAQVNTVDNFGMTPLLYAASIDFGDTTVMEQLIAAGADPAAKNRDGLTALDLAKQYHHKAHASILARRTPQR